MSGRKKTGTPPKNEPGSSPAEKPNAETPTLVESVPKNEHSTPSAERSTPRSVEVTLWGAKGDPLFVMGVVIGLFIGIIAAGFYLIFGKPDIIFQPIVANAVRQTLAAQPTLPPVTQSPVLPATSSPEPVLTSTPISQPLGPLPTPVIDILVKNDVTTWNNPTEMMDIDPTTEIVITIDPEAIFQASCNGWDIRPEPKSVSKEEGCSITFLPVSDEITTVTVNIIASDGRGLSRKFEFFP